MELLPPGEFEEEPTVEVGKAGEGELLPAQYGKKVGEELVLYEKGEEPEEEFKGFETGYRGWKLRFKEGQPRLGSLTREEVWEPGEGGTIESDWGGEEEEPFEKTSKGLYFLKTMEELRRQYPHEDIYGAVIPFGTYEEGMVGFRAQRAKVRALFRNLVSCYICRKPAKYYVHNDERFPLCERCLKRIERLIKKKGYTEEEVETVLQRLAEIYEAEIAEAPE